MWNKHLLILSLMGLHFIGFLPNLNAQEAQDTADLVLLIDGSQNVGANFPNIRELLVQLIERLDVGTNAVQLALVLYGANPEIRFYLNSYNNKRDILNVVKGLTSKSESANLGTALEQVAQTMFGPEVGGRADQGVPQALVIISAGRSADDISESVAALKQSNLLVFGVALDDSANSELQAAATDPSFVLGVSDVRTLPSVSTQLLPYINGVIKRTIAIQTEFTEALAVSNRDIVFLIDSTIGAININAVREFIRKFIDTLPIGPDQVQIGVTMFSNTARAEIDLNSYSDKASLISALSRIKPKPSQEVNIGSALDSVRISMLTPQKGSRRTQGVTQIVLLITSKPSKDSVQEPAAALRDMGVLTMAVGSRAADERELQQIAFSEDLVFMLKDFRSLTRNPREIVSKLTTLSGARIEEPTEPEIIITTIPTQRVIRDIVFMIDGSNYVGNENLNAIKDLLSGIVKQLDVRPERVRIGLMQFAERQKTEFYLNTYNNKEQVLDAIAQLRLMGGNVLNTGAAMQYALANHFQPSAGSRKAQRIQQVLVLVTGGPSQDEVMRVADRVALAGVLTFAIGAEQVELRENLKKVAFVEGLAYYRDSFAELPEIATEIMTPLITVVGEPVTSPPVIDRGERDVAFLIDGSDNVRRDFSYIRDFISKVIEPLDIGINKVRVSVVQHSETSSPSFLLNTFKTKDEVVRAVRGLSLTGGRGLNTGAALTYMKNTILSPNQGGRAEQGVPQFLIVLTAGRSSDGVREPARVLKTEGIIPFGVGVKNAERRQIDDISYSPSFSFNVAEFNDLQTIHQKINSYVSLPKTQLDVVLETVKSEGPKQDIVFIIDGSSNNENNFPVIQQFVASTVENLDVGENKIRIGVVQYGDTAQTDLSLNSHTTKEGVLNAISKLTQQGGAQRNLGMALKSVSDVLESRNGGRKEEGVPQFAVVISGGRATDNIQIPASNIKNKGIITLNIGPREINTQEMQTVSYVPEFAFVVDDLPGLSMVQEKLLSTLSDESVLNRRPFFPSGTTETEIERPSGEKKDIVFLIDGTTRMRNEFPAIQNMVQNIVRRFDIGLDKVRVAIVQYSEDPRVEFRLNEHTSQEGVLQAVSRMRSKGGRLLNTGEALNWVTKNVYQRSAGSRIEDGVPQFLILVTGGKSSDDVSGPANQLKLNFVAPLAVGSSNADLEELKLISKKPNLVYMVRDFQQQPRVEEQLLAGMNTIHTEETDPVTGLNFGKRDIIFLIDGSNSVGPNGIAHIRDFILKTVEKMNVRPDQVRVALVQYADTPKTEFSLITHDNKQDIISAVKRLRQMGGRGSNLAAAIDHVINNELKESKGARLDGASQHLVVLTGGRSTTEVSKYGPFLKKNRVNCIGVGAEKADLGQLREIASTPEDVLQVPAFPSLPTIQDRLIARLHGNLEFSTVPPTSPKPKVADIVFLVDGSINFGKDNFKKVMSFIQNMVDNFFMDNDLLRFGLSHYATDVRDVFYLNSHDDKEDILKAIERTEYKGGMGINTDNAMKHVLQKHFVKERGSRKDQKVPQILMLITGGRSQKEAKSAAQALKSSGVRVYAIGVGDFENELIELSSEQSTVARASSIEQLSDLQEQILETLNTDITGTNICTGVKEQTRACHLDVLVGFDVSSQNIFEAQKSLKTKMAALLQRITKMHSVSCSSGDPLSIQVGILAVDSASKIMQTNFSENENLLLESFTSWRGPLIFNAKSIDAYSAAFKKRPAERVKVVIHLTDGLDGQFNAMKQRMEQMKNEGVSAFILVGLERVPQFDNVVLLEFGRGFRYNRHLHVNIMDLEYELLEELDNIAERECCSVPCKCGGQRGHRGAVGMTGPKGSPGAQGYAGHPGDEGGPGERGPAGVNGTQGFRGCSGPRGAKGARGYNGEKGELGEIGLDGIGGEEGTSGAAGSSGEKGNPGLSGPKGAKGQAGDAGQTGIRGDPGTRGQDNTSRGPKGDQGDTGPPGEPGEDGISGGAGEPGRRGADGRRGQRGQPGPPGRAGENGLPGESGIGGSRGTRGPVGTLGIKGEDGNPGPRGPGGPQGPPGEKGRRGALGRKGEPGDPGPPGTVGPNGSRGEPGEDGQDGFGKPGPKGRKGDEGFPGYPGAKGAAGESGTKGGPGSKGNSGQRGVAGSIGAPGQKGELGYRGPYGDKGPSGPGVEQSSQCDLVKKIRENCPCCYGSSECPLYPTELAFALDGTSDNSVAFNTARDTVHNLLSGLTITESNCPRGARVALLLYNNDVTTEIRFSDAVRKQALLKQVKDLKPLGTNQRNLLTAIRFVAQNTFKRVRSGFLVRKVAVFFVNGPVQNKQEVARSALYLSNAGITSVFLLAREDNELRNNLQRNNTLIRVINLPSPSAAEYKTVLRTVAECNICFDACTPNPFCGSRTIGGRGKRASVTDLDVDVGFIIDSSESTWPSVFTEIKRYIANMVDKLEISAEPASSSHHARVALVQQSPYEYVHNNIGLPIRVGFGFTDHKLESDIQSFLLDKVEQLEGGRDLAAALRSTVENVFEKAPHPRQQKLLVLFVTGPVERSEEKLLKAAIEVKCKGYFIVVIGVGKQLSARDMWVLAQVASEPSEVFFKMADRLSGFADNHLQMFAQLLPQYLSLENAFYLSPEVSRRCPSYQNDQSDEAARPQQADEKRHEETEKEEENKQNHKEEMHHVSLNGREADTPLSSPAVVNDFAEPCSQDLDNGEPCRESQALWYFNKKNGYCEQFWYGGCGGNENKFETEVQCLRQCVHTVQDQPAGGSEDPPASAPWLDICTLPKDEGTCIDFTLKWYYDSISTTCQRFWYGGCSGNMNRFNTQAECETACKNTGEAFMQVAVSAALNT